MGGVDYKGAAQGKHFRQQSCPCILMVLVIIQLFAYRAIHKEWILLYVNFKKVKEVKAKQTKSSILSSIQHFWDSDLLRVVQVSLGGDKLFIGRKMYLLFKVGRGGREKREACEYQVNMVNTLLVGLLHCQCSNAWFSINRHAIFYPLDCSFLMTHILFNLFFKDQASQILSRIDNSHLGCTISYFFRHHAYFSTLPSSAVTHLLTPDFLMTGRVILGTPFKLSGMSFNIILQHYSAVLMRDSGIEEFNFQVRFHKILDPNLFKKVHICCN